MKRVFVTLLLAALVPAWPAAAQEISWSRKLHTRVVRQETQIRRARAEKTLYAATALGLKNYLEQAQKRMPPAQTDNEISTLWNLYLSQKLYNVKPLLNALQRNQSRYARTDRYTPDMLSGVLRVLEDGKRAQRINHAYPLKKYIVPIYKR